MTTFILDYEGVGRMLRGSLGRSAARHVAERVKAAAEIDAATFAQTGEYEAAFEIVDVERPDRAEVRVRNTSGHALAVEFGNERLAEPHHTLMRALMAAKA